MSARHGNAGYSSGCRCNICSTGRAAYRRQRRQERRATLTALGLATVAERLRLRAVDYDREALRVRDEDGDRLAAARFDAMARALRARAEFVAREAS